jgi:hypothetical protein
VQVEGRLDVGDDLQATGRLRRRGRRDHRADDVAEHRARRLRAAGARPLSVISVIACDSIVTALNGPLTLASGCSP